MTVSAVISATATMVTTTPAMIPAVLSHSAHEGATLSASDAAVEKIDLAGIIIDTHYTLELSVPLSVSLHTTSQLATEPLATLQEREMEEAVMELTDTLTTPGGGTGRENKTRS